MRNHLFFVYLSICGVLLAALLCAPVLSDGIPSSGSAAQTASAAQTVSGAQTSYAADVPADAAPLFPGVSEESVGALHVAAADRSFEFSRSDRHVSVNGRTADRDVFSTLLRQIVNMPITAADNAPSGEPLMTIHLQIGDARHAVQFYENPNAEIVDVAYTTQAAQHYGVTDAWRLGTLLLACDGTRILDERGNEAPAIGNAAP